MSILHNFPFVNQLHSTTFDGQIDENAGLNCVSSSICAGLRYLTGKMFVPDELKDAVYGQGYIGGQAASAYVEFCSLQGVKLWAFDGPPGELVSQVHRELSKDHPVVFTEPNPYGSQKWTHVCCFYKDEPELTCMDPFGAHPVEKSDAQWIETLVNNQIWIMELENMKITINTPGIADQFDSIDSQHWRSKKTGKIIQFALLDNYVGYDNSGRCGLDFLGHPVSNEVPLGPNKVRQNYEKGVMCWDNGTVFPLPLYDGGPGQDPRVVPLQQQVAALTAQLAQPANVPADVQAKLDHDEEIIKQARLLFSIGGTNQ